MVVVLIILMKYSWRHKKNNYLKYHSIQNYIIQGFLFNNSITEAVAKFKSNLLFIKTAFTFSSAACFILRYSSLLFLNSVITASSLVVVVVDNSFLPLHLLHYSNKYDIHLHNPYSKLSIIVMY